MLKNYLAMTLLLIALLSLNLATNTALQADPPTGETKDNLKKTSTAESPEDKKKKERQAQIEKSKVYIDIFERDAVKGGASTKRNGVKLAIKAKPVANGKFTDIQVAWTITYTGPRSPLIIVQPTLELPTAQTTVSIWAFPQGKNYGLPFVAITPIGWPVPGMPNFLRVPGKVTELQSPFSGNGLSGGQMFRKKDFFVRIAKGKIAKGMLIISGQELKEILLKTLPDDFDSKKPPRLFMEVIHDVSYRGEAWNLDAWTGKLVVPLIEIQGMTKW